MTRFYTATEEEITRGILTDVYFERARQVLEKTGNTDIDVVADVHCYSLPHGYYWAVFAGLQEALHLLRGKKVDVYGLNEGTIFKPFQPVISIHGNYSEFGHFESSVLGLLRHSSSIATKAARCKMAANWKTLLFFGIRCVHPTIAPMADRAAFIGGCDAVSGTIGAQMIGESPSGTMPHSLMVVIGDQRKAWKAFDEVMDASVPRIALCDTWFDERVEAVMASETLGDRLFGVRLDTPSSRRGDLAKIVKETRWALDLEGHGKVKIFVSGGLDEDELARLSDGVDGFGIGTAVAFPPSVDLAMDVVEVEGKPRSKKGKLPGRKQLYRCENLHDHLVPSEHSVEECSTCGQSVKPLLRPLLKRGELVANLLSPSEIRKYVLDQLKSVSKQGSVGK